MKYKVLGTEVSRHSRRKRECMFNKERRWRWSPGAVTTEAEASEGVYYAIRKAGRADQTED